MSYRTAYRIALGTAVGLCLAIYGQPVSAATGFRPRVGTLTGSASGTVATGVTVNETLVAVFKTDAGGHSAAARADIVAKRLETLVNNGLAPGAVSARRVVGHTWAVAAGNQILLLIPPEEAAAHRSSSEALARSWAAGLRRLLAEPALTFRPAGITIPTGETRLVKIGGGAPAGNVVAQDADVRISRAVFDPVSRVLTVQGLTPGRGSIEIRAGDAGISIPVLVMDYAARVRRDVTVSVTGEPYAPSGLVSRAVYAGLARAVDAAPGAQMRLANPPRVLTRLGSGHRFVAPLALHITGPDLLPVETTVNVTVANVPVSARPASALFYSNNPEQVKQSQSLFTGRLQPLKPVRLDYHHQNVSGGTLVFHADLINVSDAPASVQIISGLALPATDTVQVGRRAGASFLAVLDSNIGLVLQIPPHARVPLVTQRFADGLTVSGIVQMQQIDGAGDAVSLAVSADSDQDALVSPVGRVILAAQPDNRFAAPLPYEPSDFGSGVPLPAVSPFVFAAPQISLTGSYAVGGAWAYVRIGHTEALKDSTGALTLFGNYGADYQVILTLSNPTGGSRPVSIFFAPEAGLAAGVFRIDGGPIIELDPTAPPAEVQIARYVLSPGATRQVRLETIPLNGSSYPLSIIVHAL